MGRNEKGQFVAGEPTALTREQQIKLSRSLSESWKKRDGYIGDIVNKHPVIYNCWRSFRFTKKGKRIGNSEEWNDFRTFYNDVIGTYRDGLRLIRKDTQRPFGKDNFMWATEIEIGRAKAGIRLEYEGETLSLKELSEKYGMPFNGIKLRYYKHRNDYTTKEIIFGKKRNRGSKTPKDISDAGVKIRAKASKMISSYKHRDKYIGLEGVCDITVDWLIDNILTQPCHYCGDTHRVGCDRKDNTKGHTMDNVVPCCVECNTARGNMFSYEEMRILGRTIAEIKKKGRKKYEQEVGSDDLRREEVQVRGFRVRGVGGTQPFRLGRLYDNEGR